MFSGDWGRGAEHRPLLSSTAPHLARRAPCMAGACLSGHKALRVMEWVTSWPVWAVGSCGALFFLGGTARRSGCDCYPTTLLSQSVVHICLQVTNTPCVQPRRRSWFSSH